MKRWLWLPVFFVAAWLLPRLPHPAVDAADLEPVSLVRVAYADGVYRLITDTGSAGAGTTVKQAVQSLEKNAVGIILLDTADYVLLESGVPVTEALCRALRPGCRVCYVAGETDLAAAAVYLRIHPPEMTLIRLLAGDGEADWLEIKEVAPDGAA